MPPEDCRELLAGARCAPVVGPAEMIRESVIVSGDQEYPVFDFIGDSPLLKIPLNDMMRMSETAFRSMST